MAVSFIAASNTGTAASNTGMSVAVPTGVQAGDVVLVNLGQWNGGTPVVVTPPSGFTQILAYSSGDGAAKNTVWYKRLTAADTGTYAWAYTPASFTIIDAVAFRGVIGTGNPVTATNTATGTFGSVTSIAVTANAGDGLAYFFYNDSNGTHTPPTGFTEVSDNDSGSADYKLVTSGGTQTASGASISSSSATGVALLALAQDGGAYAPVGTLSPGTPGRAPGAGPGERFTRPFWVDWNAQPAAPTAPTWLPDAPRRRLFIPSIARRGRQLPDVPLPQSADPPLIFKRGGFEQQTVGVTPNATNSPLFGDDAMSAADTSTGSGNTMTYDNTTAAHGANSVKLTMGGTTAGLFGYKVNPQGTLDRGVFRFYINLSAYPSTASQIGGQFRAAGVPLGRTQIDAAGQLQANAGGTTVNSGATTLALNTWYRVEASIAGTMTATTTMKVDLYLGDSLASLVSLTATGAGAGLPIDSIRFGAFAATSTAVFYIDDVALTVGTTAYIGPYPAVVPPVNHTARRTLLPALGSGRRSRSSNFIATPAVVIPSSFTPQIRTASRVKPFARALKGRQAQPATRTAARQPFGVSHRPTFTMRRFPFSRGRNVATRSGAAPAATFSLHPRVPLRPAVRRPQGRTSQPVPSQAAAAQNPVLVFTLARRLKPLVRRTATRDTAPVIAQVAAVAQPMVFTIQHRVKVALRRIATRRTARLATFTAPVGPLARPAVRARTFPRRGTNRRTARIATVAPTAALFTKAPARPPRVALKRVAARTAAPVPTQQAAAPTPSFTDLNIRRVRALLRRGVGRWAQPVQAQQATAPNPAFVAVLIRRVRPAIRRGIGRFASPTPPQQTPVVAQPILAAHARVKPALLRRSGRTNVHLAAHAGHVMLPVAPARRRVAVARRGRLASPTPPQVILPPAGPAQTRIRVQQRRGLRLYRGRNSWRELGQAISAAYIEPGDITEVYRPMGNLATVARTSSSLSTTTRPGANMSTTTRPAGDLTGTTRPGGNLTKG